MKVAELDTIADGVAHELFAHELAKVAANIVDQNTSALAKRVITMKFTFSPDDMRDEAKVTVDVYSKLASTKPYSKTVWLGTNNGKATIFGQDTKQMDLMDAGVEPIKGASHA